MGSPEVVISGIGGNFPQCESVTAFFDSLKKQQSLIVTDHGRWQPGSMGLRGDIAATKQLGCLDSYFFGMHRQLALVTSPLTRSTIEKSFEAIIDAGLNPSEIHGTNTNVYMNSYDPEHEATFLSPVGYHNLAVVGASKTMTANRISYFYGLTGHSCSFTSSGIWLSQVLEMAHLAISSGECDMALVGGAFATLHVESLYAAATADYLEKDGVPKPFDAAGGGPVRGDAQVIFVLQRADLARRSYATIVGAMGRPVDPRSGDILVPSNRGKEVLWELYNKCGIDPAEIQYVECNGCGHQLSDVTEIASLGAVLTQNRKEPVLIGSAQGTIGHSGSAAGFVSAVKLIGILESGIIPPTANFKKPHPLMKPIIDGRMKVVTEQTEINVENGQYFAISEQSFVGDIGHVILKVNSKTKKTWKVEEELPRLILMSNRTEDGFARLTDEIHKQPFDPEYYGLLNRVYKHRIKGHPLKAFTICPKPENFTPQSCDDNQEQQPLWFVFSGMGSQWAGMGRDLMRLPDFRRTIECCHEVLLPKGLDLIEILTTSDETIFDDILNCFVGIAAVQIGLVKLLRLMGIEPDGFIGHSVGEQACAFMDGCIDERQTILCAYARGKASNETTLIPGMMAAIGMGYNDIKDKVPASIDVACHNSKDSCTISGPTADVESYVEHLKSQKIFARTVNVANIAYHSRYIKTVAPHLLRRLSEVIVEPAQRSSKWISTSVPEENWESDAAKYCSPEYLTNNLLNSVLFEEGLKQVPEKAILVEVAPHGLLQAILRKSRPQGAINIPLTQRNAADNLVVFLNAIGKLYLAGRQPDVSRLYPKVEYPVSRGTPPLNNLLTWSYIKEDNVYVSSRDYKRDVKTSINIKSPSETIRGVQYCSPGHLLLLVWQCMASVYKFDIEQLPVVFKDLLFFDPIELPSEGTINLRVGVQRETPFFELSYKKRPILQGGVTSDWHDDELKLKRTLFNPPAIISRKIHLTADHIYSDLAVRGHTYSTSLQQIHSIDVTDSEWVVNYSHRKDWDVVLSTMLQTVQLQRSEQSQLSVYPWRIRRLAIHPVKFMAADPQDGVLYLEPATNVVHSEGLLLQGIQTRPLTLNPQNPITEINSVRFIPNDGRDVQSRGILRKLAVQLATEIQPLSSSIPLLHLKGASSDANTDIEELKKCAEKFGVELKHTEYQTNGRAVPSNVVLECFGGLVISDADAVSSAATVAASTDVLILTTVHASMPVPNAVSSLTILAQSVDCDHRMLLLRAPGPKENISVVRMDPSTPSEDFTIVPEAGSVLLWESEPCEGVQPIIKQLFKTIDRAMLRLVFILDAKAPPFSLALPLYRDRLALGLRVNVYKDGAWVSLQNAEVATEAGRLSTPEDHIMSALSIQRIPGVNVKYWGLNKATEVRGHAAQFTMDYSGTTENGNMIGVAYTKACQSRRDTILSWPLPEGWTFEEGASVPVAYCTAYYALKVLCKAIPGEAILITDAHTALGQALVRVALEFRLQILAYVSRKYESEFRSTFSKFVNEKEVSIISGSRKQLYIQVKMIRTNGVGIVASIRQNDLCAELLSIASRYGRVVHFGGIDLSTSARLGMSHIVRSLSLYGLSDDVMFQLMHEDRAVLSSLMNEGLKSSANATVKPLKVLQLPEAITRIPWSEDCFRSRKVLSRVKHSTNAFVSGLCDIVLLSGGTSQEKALLTSWFSARGASQIMVVAEKHSLQLLLRRTRVSKYITLLTETDLTKGIRRTAIQGRLNTAVLVAQNSTEEHLIEQMEKFENRKGMTLVVFGGDHCVRGAVIKACDQLRAGGVRTVLTAGSVETMVSTRVLDWLLQPDGEPKVIHLRNAKEMTSKVSASDLLEKLPSDSATLAALYGSMSSKPVVHEITTMGPRWSVSREVFPLFAVPSFSGQGIDILKPLAERFLGPLFSVQLPHRVTSVKELAVDICNAIKEAQPIGPYAVLGSDWTAVIAQQVAVELEERGEKVILFLLDADLNAQIDDLRRFHERSDAQILLIKATLGAKASPEVLHKIASTSTWEEKMRVISSLLGDDEIRRTSAVNCLTFIHNWIESLIRHKLQDNGIQTHLIRSGQPKNSEYVENKNCQFCGVMEHYRDVYGSPKLLTYMNSNMGYSTMRNLSDRLAAINV